MNYWGAQSFLYVLFTHGWTYIINIEYLSAEFLPSISIDKFLGKQIIFYSPNF